MLSNLVGQVSAEAAFVLAAMFACIGVIGSIWIGVRRNRTEISNQFELEKLRQKTDSAERLYKAETERSYKFKQLDQNLITSHTREPDRGDRD